jgi:hypothetical protein
MLPVLCFTCTMGNEKTAIFFPISIPGTCLKHNKMTENCFIGENLIHLNSLGKLLLTVLDNFSIFWYLVSVLKV